jgi:HAE1 family hydrophobic/amphiphilic exporter-1
MTSFAFILGVVPLAFASGAGAELRRSLGVAVFFGMIGVTLFGLICTPVFYVVTRRLNDAISRTPPVVHPVPPPPGGGADGLAPASKP